MKRSSLRLPLECLDEAERLRSRSWEEERQWEWRWGKPRKVNLWLNNPYTLDSIARSVGREASVTEEKARVVMSIIDLRPCWVGGWYTDHYGSSAFGYYLGRCEESEHGRSMVEVSSDDECRQRRAALSDRLDSLPVLVHSFHCARCCPYPDLQTAIESQMILGLASWCEEAQRLTGKKEEFAGKVVEARPRMRRGRVRLRFAPIQELMTFHCAFVAALCTDDFTYVYALTLPSLGPSSSPVAHVALAERHRVGVAQLLNTAMHTSIIPYAAFHLLPSLATLLNAFPPKVVRIQQHR